METVWDLELGAEMLDEESSKRIERNGLDQARYLAAYSHSSRWSCVSAIAPPIP